jgi:hypothetical protein
MRSFFQRLRFCCSLVNPYTWKQGKGKDDFKLGMEARCSGIGPLAQCQQT